MKRQTSIDYIMLCIVLGFMVFSLIAVYSGTGQYTDGQSFYFARRQLIWYLISMGIMLSFHYFDYDLLEKWAVYLYTLGLILLVVVRFFGVERNGSQRWIELPFMDLQPSEFMKIFIIIFIAAIYKSYGTETLSFVKSILLLVKTILVMILPFLLILAQPDLGTAMMIVASGLGMLLVAPIGKRMIFLIMLSVSGLVAGIMYMFINNEQWLTTFLKPHQVGRIYSWINPGEYMMDFGYQLRQAIIAIGAGQLTGSGFNQGHQVQSGRVPEAHTDFIFAVIGEEFGFAGASLLIILYFLLIYRIITIALKAHELFAVYICVGVITLLSFQVFQNIGMTIGLMPVTGVALPFVSYGGSALITNMIALGLIQSIYARTKNYMFSSEVEN